MSVTVWNIGSSSGSGGGSVSVPHVFAAVSQAAMLALAATRGDFAFRSDNNKVYILSSADPTQIANWTQLVTPAQVTAALAGATATVGFNQQAINNVTSFQAYAGDNGVYYDLLTNASGGAQLFSKDDVFALTAMTAVGVARESPSWIAFPAGALILGLTGLVTVAITGPAAHKLGWVGADDAAGAAIGVAAGSKSPGFLSTGPVYNTTGAALKLRITPADGTTAFTGGFVRVCRTYLLIRPTNPAVDGI